MVLRLVSCVAIVAASLFGPCSVATVSAQTAEAESVKALRELVAEVRSLRATIEQYANAQIQAQAVGEMLTVQQRRVADLTVRLDQARRELDGATGESRRIAGELANRDESLRQITDPKIRADMELELRRMKEEGERRTEQEQALRNRESDLLNSLAVEEAKWNDLVDRLNQWLRR